MLREGTFISFKSSRIEIIRDLFIITKIYRAKRGMHIRFGIYGCDFSEHSVYIFVYTYMKLLRPSSLCLSSRRLPRCVTHLPRAKSKFFFFSFSSAIFANASTSPNLLEYVGTCSAFSVSLAYVHM